MSTRRTSDAYQRNSGFSRRKLEARSTKYSNIVLDGGPVGPGNSVVIGVNQAQRRISDPWWRADRQPAAEAVPKK